MANLHYKNVEVNAPWWWKRLESALVFLFTGLIPIIGLTKSLSPTLTHDVTLVFLPGLILFVKTVGIFFGESEIVAVKDSGGQSNDDGGFDSPTTPPPVPIKPPTGP